MAGQRLQQRCAGPVSGRAQVAALLDFENLLFEQRRVSGEAVRAGFERIVAVLRGLGDVRFAVGCCDRWLAGILAPVAVGSGVRIHPCALGKDCADRQLLRRTADVPPAIATMVVGSGDHAFAPFVAEQGLRGRRTVVIGRHGGISRTLRCAADEVVELPRSAALAS